MMVSMETYLLRGKRRLERWADVPWLREAAVGMAYGVLGFALAGADFWGGMQPAAMAFTAASEGLLCLTSGIGSMLGYRLFWGSEGTQGAVWVLCAMLLGAVCAITEQPRRRSRLALGAACVTSFVGLYYQYGVGHDISPTLFLFRILLAGGGTWLLTNRKGAPVRTHIAFGFGMLAICSLPGAWNPGHVLLGGAASVLPLPGAALAGIGADLSGRTEIPLTAVVCLSYLLQQLPLRETLRRMTAPGTACAAVMLMEWKWDWQLLAAVALGGAAGGMIPWRMTFTPMHSGVGAIQVHLEQGAAVLTAFQRQILEYSSPPPDEAALLEQVKAAACRTCVNRNDCKDMSYVNEKLLHTTGPFPCRQARKMGELLQRARETRKRMLAQRAAQEEYRTALVQQYGFLADLLHTMADRLPEKGVSPPPRFRVQVSSRSKGREIAVGDRVLAFPGNACRYYVLLCDGMGTGLGAAEEGRLASEQIKRMLQAGFPPASVLGSMNTQMTLLGRGGAVTIDLAEIRADSGIVWIYKWGANPSWLLHRGRASKLGYATPPPGLDVKNPRESAQKAGLSRGEILVMVSDGVCAEGAAQWAEDAREMEPGQLAERIVAQDGIREDDATAVVIRLVR